jgi:membrane protein YdbS with pleckstrin-like domain
MSEHDIESPAELQSPTEPASPVLTSTPTTDEGDVADEQVHPLDPRFVNAERFGWWITTAVLSGGGAVGLISTWFGDPDGLAVLVVALGWLLLTGVLLWATIAWPPIQYRHTSYVVSPMGLEIRRGVIWRRVINLPLSRVQHTDVQQGPVQRRYGIASLVVHTAGTTAASVTLAGLSYETALRIRDFLVREGGSDDGV